MQVSVSHGSGSDLQQITVFTDDVGQHSDHSLRTLVAVVVINRAAVMPVADASIRLPRQRLDSVGRATLDVPDDALAFFAIKLLAENHRLQLAIVVRDTAVD